LDVVRLEAVEGGAGGGDGIRRGDGGRERARQAERAASLLG
jgi:hypothetical protein